MSSTSPIQRGVHRITRYSLPHFGPDNRRLRSGSLVAHIDIDAFYAQIEQEDFDLRGIPLIVGSWNDPGGQTRGIVAAASYEARQFGIRTGMSHHEATQHCPFVVAFRIHYEKYRAVSHSIHKFLEQKCPTVEGYSMDEFYVQIPDTHCASEQSVFDFVTHLQNGIRTNTGLTSSIGVAHSKSFAKLGSDLRKPNAISILLSSDAIEQNVYPLPVSLICGLGSKRAEKLKRLGVSTIGDAVTKGKGPFQSAFGPYLGELLWEAVTGNEVSPLHEVEEPPKDLHHIHTLSRPTADLDQLKGELMVSVSTVCKRLRFYELATSRWEAYLRFDDQQWEGVPIPIRLPEPSCSDTVVFRHCWRVVNHVANGFLRIGHTFLGAGITAMETTPNTQLMLNLDTNPDPVALHRAMDACNDYAGASCVGLATALTASRERVHFLEA